MTPQLEANFALGTFSAAGGPRFPGLLIEGKVLPVAAAQVYIRASGAVLKGVESILSLLDHWQHNFPLLDGLAHRFSVSNEDGGAFVSVEQLQMHAPVDMPRQIFCSGANYFKHVVDLICDDPSFQTEGVDATQRRHFAEKLMFERAANGKPFVFSKIVSSVTGPFDPVIIPTDALKPDWGLELGVVIGKRARRVSCTEALDYVAGYVVVNDITERTKVYRPDTAQMGMDWLSSKNAPSFLPMGPFLVPAAYVGDPQDLQLILKLNDEVMQRESTADMIFSVARLIEFISESVQLLPGDLICTGSPAGNGTHYNRFLRPGDVLEGSISRLGVQRNPCIQEA
jgi:2-keto-4-pentenoate hydratase/2-oxohepta-3-ene-1,7-dioic acid hydratase in catechol pathway